MKTLKRMLLAVCLILSLVCVSPAEDFGSSGNLMKTNTKKDFPNIFRPIGNFFKRLFGKKRSVVIHDPFPMVTDVVLSKTELSIGCSKKYEIPKNKCSIDNPKITVATEINNQPGEEFVSYFYKTSAGTIVGNGPKVTWDLSDVQPGTYTISVTIDNGCGVCNPPQTKEIKVIECVDCYDPFARCPRNPTVTASAKSVRQGELITFTANADNLSEIKAVCNWSISSGEIVSGQNTQKLTVRASAGTDGKTLTAVVDINDDCTDHIAHTTVEIIKD